MGRGFPIDRFGPNPFSPFLVIESEDGIIGTICRNGPQEVPGPTPVSCEPAFCELEPTRTNSFPTVISSEQRSRFLRLYDDFVASYLETPEGRSHIALYERAAREGRENYRHVLERLDRGEEITDDVLEKLLPHRNALGNVRRGAWIHVTPAVQGNLRRLFERRGWVNEGEWPHAAREIFRFIHNSLTDPANLEEHCNAFAEGTYVCGMQCGYLTPVLEAVKPRLYAVVNPRTVKAVQKIFGLKLTTGVARYPEANAFISALMKELGDELTIRSGLTRFPPVRLFNLFCWWGSERDAFARGAAVSYADREKNAATSSPLQVREPQPTEREEERKEGPVSLEESAALLHMPEERLKRIVDILREKKQIILYGPPGTGKTYLAEEIARHLSAGTGGFREMMQFHPSYSYEDFIQGIRPQRSEEGMLDYPVIEGRFLRFCREARMRGDAPCVLTIDEINRANLSSVFGELMYLLEYRNRSARLAGDGRLFSIPENVYLIGTMNTADRSIALVDYALRRRFAFIELEPDYDVLRRFYASGSGSADGVDPEGLIALVKGINGAIEDRYYRIGISFFLKSDLRSVLRDVWETEIEPYLEEFFFDDPGKVEEFRWERIEGRVLR